MRLVDQSIIFVYAEFRILVKWFWSLVYIIVMNLHFLVIANAEVTSSKIQQTKGK